MFGLIDRMQEMLESIHSWWQTTYTYSIIDGIEDFIWGFNDAVGRGIATVLNYALEESVETLTWLLEFVG
jgi:hypothetical protein